VFFFFYLGLHVLFFFQCDSWVEVDLQTLVQTYSLSGELIASFPSTCCLNPGFNCGCDSEYSVCGAVDLAIEPSGYYYVAGRTQLLFGMQQTVYWIKIIDMFGCVVEVIDNATVIPQSIALYGSSLFVGDYVSLVVKKFSCVSPPSRNCGSISTTIGNVGSTRTTSMTTTTTLALTTTPGTTTALPTTVPHIGDLNGDGVVDSRDLVLLLESWGPCNATTCNSDLDGDLNTDILDLVTLLDSIK
jgi:hypothetical protein